MDIRNRIITQFNLNNKYTLGGDLIEKLVLFDDVILHSINFEEIPPLIEIFGFNEIVNLLDSGILKIYIDNFTFASTGQTEFQKTKQRRKILPLCSYRIEQVAAIPQSHPQPFSSIRKELNYFIDDRLKKLTINNISQKQKSFLDNKIRDSIVHYSDSTANSDLHIENYREVLETETIEEYKITHPCIRAAIIQNLYTHSGSNINTHELKITIEPLNEELNEFIVINNLDKIFNIDKTKIHEIIEKSLLGVSAKNFRISQMKGFTAIPSFRENEIPMFEENISFLLNKFISDKNITSNYNTVLEVKKLPDFSHALRNNKISLDNLIEIRTSRECSDFRTWLWSQDSINNDDLNERLTSLSQIFGDFLKRNPGKAIKFLLNLGLNMIPSPYNIPITTTLSFYENFLKQDVLPGKNALSFINNKLPTIYKS